MEKESVPAFWLVLLYDLKRYIQEHNIEWNFRFLAVTIQPPMAIAPQFQIIFRQLSDIDE